MFEIFRNRKKVDQKLYDSIIYKCRLRFTPHLIERQPNRYVSKFVVKSGLSDKLHPATDKAA
jgi:hypothetical protein